MANSEHLKIINQGVQTWNLWRKDNASVTLDNADLAGADLAGANLVLANLRGANLTNADLHGAFLLRSSLVGADLSGANLVQAKLGSANLRYANLANADLTEADFAVANLTNADLSMTDLTSAVFYETDLTSANLTESVFCMTTLASSCLKESVGLKTCEHHGRSSIDHRTIELSEGIPEYFLRQCGLSDIYIEYLPSLLNTPIQFYDCFISYSHQDEEFAKKLHSDLQAGSVRCWFAPEDLKIGAPVRETIENQIRFRDKLLVIFSEHSIESDWVEHEVNTALENEEESGKQKLFPIRVDNSIMEAQFGWAKKIRQAHNPTGRHIGDFTQWKNHDPYMASFERLLRDLKIDRE